jgi:hypothetical protein
MTRCITCKGNVWKILTAILVGRGFCFLDALVCRGENMSAVSCPLSFHFPCSTKEKMNQNVRLIVLIVTEAYFENCVQPSWDH